MFWRRCKMAEILVTGRLFERGPFRAIRPVAEELVDGAASEVHLLSFVLSESSSWLLARLVAVAKRGVTVRLALDVAPPGGPEASRELEELGSIPWVRIVGAEELGVRLHAKVLVVDRRVAVVGSANFTAGGGLFNHEIAVLLDDRRSVWRLASLLDGLFGATLGPGKESGPGGRL